MTPEQEARIRALADELSEVRGGSVHFRAQEAKRYGKDLTALLAEVDRLRDVSVKNIRTLEWTARRLKEHGLSTCELEAAIGQTAAALTTEPNGESNG